MAKHWSEFRERGWLRWQAALWSLLLFGLLLARGGVPAVRAQGQHVHHWTAGQAPNSGIELRHKDGSPITPENPAKRGDTLRIYHLSRLDWDQCTEPGCPFPDGVADDSLNW